MIVNDLENRYKVVISVILKGEWEKKDETVKNILDDENLW